jgi:hypothetical protein
MKGTLLLFCAACALWGQTPTATVVGTVKDPTGLAVMAAKVEVRNSGTNEVWKVETDQRGEFTVADLTPGIYAVSISQPGFRTLYETGLELEVEQQARMEFHLQLGSVSEKVVVMASVPLINTENGEKGDVMVAAEIAEMPLDGRDFTNLGLLTPGAVTGNPQGGYGSFASVNGARSDNTNILVDGNNNRTPITGGAVSRPNVDAIQEFKMETSGYSAETGRFAGGVVNVVLKSGANQLHGALFEFLRNNDLNARNFFATTIPPYRRNQFGGMISGPVYIPKLYNGRNHTFFMFSWESYRQGVGSSALAVVPTVALTQGNFSGLAAIKDPLNGNAAFPGNQIPLSRISPASLKLEAYYPSPNYPGANNYYSAPLTPTNWDNPLFRIDQIVSSKDSLSFRYLKRYDRAEAPAAFGNWGTNRPDHQLLTGLNYTRMFTPTLVNEARIGYERSPTKTTPFDQGTNYNALFGMSGGPTDPKLFGFPEITIAGYAQLGPAFQQPNIYCASSFDESDTMTWIKGPHLIKFGGDALRTEYNQLAANNSRGTYNFTNVWTGNAYADFLLGYLVSDIITLGSTPVYIRSTDFGFFFQDDWKITSKLTLNLGLRYELPLPPHDKYGRWSTFDPQLDKVVVTSLAGALPGVAYTNSSSVETAQQAGLPSSLMYPDYKDFAPRFGFAWRPLGGNQTVLRGGYGIFYGGNEMQDMETFVSLQFPWVVSESLNRSSNPNYLTLTNPFPVAPNLTTNAGSITIWGMQMHAPTPYVQSWNLTAERDLGHNSAIEIGYVGSKGTHWDKMSNLNQPYRSAATAPNFPVPYPGWSSINLYNFWANSSYNALNATFRRRFVHNFFYRVGYSYAKSIDEASRQGDNNGQPQDARDWKAERGRSEFDFGHSLLLSFSWQAPRDLNIFLRGWQLAGTGIAHTGPPFTPTNSNANLAIGEASRPNRVCKGNVPNPTPTHWFNASCFPVVPDGSYVFGNSGRDILDGPGQIAINVSFSRNFAIRERSNLQFRWETFNVLNHPNFPLPVATVNTANAGTIQSAADPRTMQGALRLTF